MTGLKHLREAAGLTQKQLGELLGVGQGAIAHWELGTRKPGLDYINMCRDFFGCTYDELLMANDILSDEEGENNGAGHPEYL